MKQFYYSAAFGQRYVCQYIDGEYIFCRLVPLLEYVMYYMERQSEFYIDNNQGKWLCLYRTNSKSEMVSYVESFITIEETQPKSAGEACFKIA